MPVSSVHIRDILLPGLYEVTGSYSGMAAQWEATFAADAASRKEWLVVLAEATPISLPAAVAMGVAAAVIKNPTVTRRFFSWFNAVLE